MPHQFFFSKHNFVAYFLIVSLIWFHCVTGLITSYFSPYGKLYINNLWTVHIPKMPLCYIIFPQHNNFSRHLTFHRRTTNWIKWIRFDFMCNACFIFMFTLPSWGQWTVLTRTRCLHISLILFVTVYKWRNHHLPFSSSKLAEVQYNLLCRYVNEWWILFSCIS